MLNADNSESRPLMTNEQLASLGGGRVAYVKPIRSEDLSRLFPRRTRGPARTSTLCLARCRRHADYRNRLARCRRCQCHAERTRDGEPALI